MKIVFMGTPDFAAASLQALLGWKNAEIMAVYCQPDRPVGRGHKLQIGPVKKLALEYNLPVCQPVNFKDKDTIDALAGFRADVLVVSAYGLILPQEVLDAAPMGAINVHGSLLPEYRGAAPIQRAVMNGAQSTGITIMRMVLKLDSGPMLMQRALAIGFEQTAGEVHDKLADLGGKLLVEALERIAGGCASSISQDESKATYATKLTKADGMLDFSKTTRTVHNKARGVTPWPGAQVVLLRRGTCGNELELLHALVQKGRPMEGEADKNAAAKGVPGTVLQLQNGVIPVICADALYGLEQIKPSGGKSMNAAAFANGYLKNCSAVVAGV
jgi:methionyl-tRNA formyltransferase